jgi:hypothetical protein
MMKCRRKIEVKFALNPRGPLFDAAHSATRLGSVEKSGQESTVWSEDSK